MQKTFSPLKNEEGAVMIVFTLMLLALLTVVALASINTANTEVQIAGAELIYQSNFYLAEGAAMEAANWLENNPIDLDAPPAWMEATEGALTESEINAFWASPNAEDFTIDADASFIADYEGVAGGSSEDMDKTTLHDITIYGRSQKRGGLTKIRLGYRKPF